MYITKRIAAAAAAFVIASCASAAFAEGFGVYEWSAPGTAMGEAYMFASEDPSVLAYNPAQITRLNGSYFSIGTSWVNPAISVSFNNSALNADRSDRYDNKYSPSFVPYMYYATKAGQNSWWGVAVFCRFGNNIEYDDMWAGRYDTIYSGIKGVTVQPTYAFKLNDKLSMGLGVDINYVDLEMKKDTPIISSQFAAMGLTNGYAGDIRSDLNGDTTELGWVASLMYDFTPKTSVALVYRSRIEHTMNAETDFSYDLTGQASSILASLPASTRSALASRMPASSGANGKVTLPDSLAIGLGHKFNDRTRIELNAVWTNWKTYDALNIYFDDGPLGSAGSFADKNWKASWRFGFGIEHKLSDKWSVLGGYVFDESPVPDDTMDFTVPTGDRHRGSIGFKYRPNGFSEWTLAYTAIWAGSRDNGSKINGYDYASAHINDGLTQVLSLGCTFKLK